MDIGNTLIGICAWISVSTLINKLIWTNFSQIFILKIDKTIFVLQIIDKKILSRFLALLMANKHSTQGRLSEPNF